MVDAKVDTMGTVMFQFPWPGRQPTLVEVAERYGVREDQLDAQYGVVLVDPQASLYVALLDKTETDRVQSSLSQEELDVGAGVFVDLPIEPARPPAEPPGPPDAPAGPPLP
jgi:hypothetical protein